MTAKPASSAKKKPLAKKVVARNRRARHDFHLEAETEAGIQLRGTEVKAMREGGTALDQAYCSFKDGELFLHSANIPQCSNASWNLHPATRVRKLLLHRTELKKFEKESRLPGVTIIPLEIYFSENNFAKVLIALGRGKKLHDKREDLGKKEAQREMARALGRRR